MSLLGLLALSGAGVNPAPVQHLLAWDGSTAINLCVDANSYYAQWIYPSLDQVAQFGVLMGAAGATHSSTASPGQRWVDMTAGFLDVQSKLDGARLNILVCGEDRNTAASAWADGTVATVQQCVDLCLSTSAQYITARRAEGWDRIVKCGTIPTDHTPEAVSLNQSLLAVDEYWRMETNRADRGVAVFADFRTYSPLWFGGDGTDPTVGFAATTATCANLGPGGTPDGVHPAGVARDAMANAIAAALRTLTV